MTSPDPLALAVEALVKHGRHMTGCGITSEPQSPCDCGYAELLSDLRRARERAEVINRLAYHLYTDGQKQEILRSAPKSGPWVRVLVVPLDGGGEE